VISDSSIHSSRKKLKKARATLRLIRDELPDGTFRSEHLALRDSARPLNAIRDAKLLIDALDRPVKTQLVKATERYVQSRCATPQRRDQRDQFDYCRTEAPGERHQTRH